MDKKVNTGIGIVDKLINADEDVVTVGVDINPKSLYPLVGVLVAGAVLCIILWKKL